jgi:uncharacterized cupredoxin-like copper-binding protein
VITTAALLLSPCLLGCGGGGTTTQVANEDNAIRVAASDRQDYNADIFEVAPGMVTFELSQVGIQEHTLVVEGWEDEMRLVVVDGGTDSGSIDLEPGRYLLYCDIAGHRASGMEARLTVG